MNISAHNHNHHPEYLDMLHGMKTGHLPASAEDIALAEKVHDHAAPKDTHSAQEGLVHPEYAEYAHFAKSMGYHVPQYR